MTTATQTIPRPRVPAPRDSAQRDAARTIGPDAILDIVRRALQDEHGPNVVVSVRWGLGGIKANLG